MADLMLANVTSSCGDENATTDTNWTTECATGRRQRDDEVPAIDCVTWILVIADHGHLSWSLLTTVISPDHC